MKTIAVELKWSAVFFVFGIAWMALERAVGPHGEHIDKHATYTNLATIPAIAIYVLALLKSDAVVIG